VSHPNLRQAAKSAQKTAKEDTLLVFSSFEDSALPLLYCATEWSFIFFGTQASSLISQLNNGT